VLWMRCLRGAGRREGHGRPHAPYHVGCRSGRAARTAVTLRTERRRRAAARQIITGSEEPPWPWWLGEDERNWLRWQIRSVAHRLLAEAVEGLAYHLALCKWPDEISTIPPVAPEHCGAVAAP